MSAGLKIDESMYTPDKMREPSESEKKQSEFMRMAANDISRKNSGVSPNLTTNEWLQRYQPMFDDPQSIPSLIPKVQRKQTDKWINESENPDKELKKLGISMLLADRLGMNLTDIYDSYEARTEALFGRKLPVDKQFNEIKYMLRGGSETLEKRAKELETNKLPPYSYNFGGVSYPALPDSAGILSPQQQSRKKMLEFFQNTAPLLTEKEQMNEVWKGLKRGTASLLYGASLPSRIVGADELAAGIEEYIEEVNQANAIPEVAQKAWEKMKGGKYFDKSWWLANAPEQIPFQTAALLAGAGAGTTTALGAKALSLGSKLVKGSALVSATGASSFFEGMVEGGQVAHQLLQNGASQDEAAAAGRTVMLENAGLLTVTNGLAIGMGMVPGKVARTMAFGLGTATEPVEELMQNQISKSEMVEVMPKLLKEIHPAETFAGIFDLTKEDNLDAVILSMFMGLGEPTVGMFLRKVGDARRGLADPIDVEKANAKMTAVHLKEFQKLKKMPDVSKSEYEKKKQKVYEKHISDENVVEQPYQMADDLYKFQRKEAIQKIKEIDEGNIKLSELSKTELAELAGESQKTVLNREELYNLIKTKQPLDLDKYKKFREKIHDENININKLSKKELAEGLGYPAKTPLTKEQLRGIINESPKEIETKILRDKLLDYLKKTDEGKVLYKEAELLTLQDRVNDPNNPITVEEAQRYAEEAGYGDQPLNEIVILGNNFFNKNDVLKHTIELALNDKVDLTKPEAGIDTLIEERVHRYFNSRFRWDGKNEVFKDKEFNNMVDAARQKAEAHGYTSTRNNTEWLAEIAKDYAISSDPAEYIRDHGFAGKFRELLDTVREYLQKVLNLGGKVQQMIKEGIISDELRQLLKDSITGEITEAAVNNEINKNPAVRKAEQDLTKVEKELYKENAPETEQRETNSAQSRKQRAPQNLKTFTAANVLKSYPVVDKINELGKIRKKPKDYKGGEYDGYIPYGKTAGFGRFIYSADEKSGLLPDEMAQYLYDEGVLASPDVNTLWETVEGEINSRKTSRQGKAEKSRKLLPREEQAVDFAEDTEKPSRRNQEKVETDELKIGDTVTVKYFENKNMKSEQLEVTNIDPDTLEVTLKDGERYGIQKIEKGQSFYANKVEENETDKGLTFQLTKEVKQFSDQINNFINEKFDVSKDFIVTTRTPTPLLEAGLNDYPIEMTVKTFNKINKPGRKHNIDIDTIKQLPVELNEPVAVLKSQKNENSVIVLTKLKDYKDEFIIIPIQKDTVSKIHKINEIKSVYGKDSENLFKWLQNKNNYLWMNEKELQGALSAGLRLPMDATLIEELLDNINNSLSAQNIKSDNNTTYQVTAYHGSPYSFDQFTADKIGTGEGAQAFGWGLYFTSQEDVAKFYAEKLKRNQFQSLEDSLNAIQIGEKSLYDDYGITQKFDNLIEFAKDNKTDEVIKIFEKDLKIWNELKTDKTYPFQEYAAQKSETIEQLIKDLKKYGVKFQGGRNLYNVTLWENHEENLLDWYEPVTDKQKQLIKEQALKENLTDRWGNSVSNKGYYPNSILFSQGMTAENFYQELTRDWFDGNEKDASLFLKRAGIDGIKYPVGTLSGQEKSDKYNYVVFDENAVKIDHNITYQLDAIPDYAVSHRIQYIEEEVTDLSDMTKSGELVPDDFYTHPYYYADTADKAAQESLRVIRQTKGKPEKTITIYRALPEKYNEFNPGDWITLSKTYAQDEVQRHGGHVISKKVKAKEIIWDGNDVNEFAYYPMESRNNITYQLAANPQIFTPEFKNWFGDWETAALIKKVSNYVDNAIDKKSKEKPLSLGEVNPYLNKKLKDILGYNIFKHEINSDDLRHMLKQHGKDKFPVTKDTLKIIPYILERPTSIAPGSINPEGRLSVKISRKIDGKIVYIEAETEKNGVLSGKTMYIAPSGRSNAKSPAHTSKTAPGPSYKDIIAHILNNANNVSKVVDYSGKPLVVYHGSPYKNIKAFDNNKQQNGFLGKGFYFSPYSGTAGKFTIQGSKEGEVYPVYLNVKNPVEIRGYSGREDVPGNVMRKAVNEFNNNPKKDGIILYGTELDEVKIEEIAVKSPEQIKSATANRGTFDKSNPDITMQLASLPEMTQRLINQYDQIRGIEKTFEKYKADFLVDKTHEMKHEILGRLEEALGREAPFNQGKKAEDGYVRGAKTSLRSMKKDENATENFLKALRGGNVKDLKYMQEGIKRMDRQLNALGYDAQRMNKAVRITKTHIDRLQSEVETLIKALPEELRWQALSRIRTIGKKVGNPTAIKRYFRETLAALDRIIQKQEKYDNIGMIIELIRTNKERLSKSNIVKGKVDVQLNEDLKYIENILQQKDETTEKEITDLQEQLNNTENEELMEKIARQLGLLETYGSIKKKGPSDVKKAREELQKYINGKKLSRQLLLEQRWYRDEKLREKIVDIVSNGKGLATGKIREDIEKRNEKKYKVPLECIKSFVNKQKQLELLFNVLARSQKFNTKEYTFNKQEAEVYLNALEGKEHVPEKYESIIPDESLKKSLKEYLTDKEEKVLTIKAKNGYTTTNENFLTPLYDRIHDAYKLRTTIARESETRVKDYLNKMTKTKNRAERTGAYLALRNQLDKRVDSGVYISEPKFQEYTFTKEDAEAYLNGLNAMGKMPKPLQHIIPTDAMIAELAEFKDKENAEKPIEVRCKVEEGKKYQIRLSQMEALQFWLSMEQERGFQIMMDTGWDDESFRQLNEFVVPEVKEFGKFLRQEYKRIKPLTDKVYEDMFFVKLADNLNYAPLAVENPNIENQWDLEDLKSGAAPTEIRPSSIKARLLHNHPLRRVSALDMYFKHIEEQANFIAVAKIGRELKAVFKNKDVQNVIKYYKGVKFQRMFNFVIDSVIRGGVQHDHKDRLADKIRSTTTLWWLTGKVDNFVKQWTSATAALAEVGPVEFSKGIADFWKSPKANAQWMLSLQYTKNRWYSGFNKDIRNLQNQTRFSADTVVTAVVKGGMLPTKTGDMLGALPGFYAVYTSNLNKIQKAEKATLDVRKQKYINDGLTETQAEQNALRDIKEKAEKEALLIAEKYSDRTQQAGQIINLGYDQMHSSWLKLFQIFQTSPRMYVSLTNEAIADAVAGKKGGYKRALNHMFVYWVLLPWMFQGAADLLRKMFDDDYEINWTNYLIASLIAPVSGYYIVGSVAYAGAQQYLNGKNYGPDLVPTTRLLNDALNAGGELSDGDAGGAIYDLFRNQGFLKTYRTVSGGYTKKKNKKNYNFKY
ncbi:MAG: hypothetical protein K9M56_04240 [Victivallales bacterium]|nr:hypothetical protein [Victivallales bacterium]